MRGARLATGKGKSYNIRVPATKLADLKQRRDYLRDKIKFWTSTLDSQGKPYEGNPELHLKINQRLMNNLKEYEKELRSLDKRIEKLGEKIAKR
jgi:hypothetical protein